MQHEFKLSMDELIDLAARRLVETKLPKGQYMVTSEHGISVTGTRAGVEWVIIKAEPMDCEPAYANLKIVKSD